VFITGEYADTDIGLPMIPAVAKITATDAAAEMEEVLMKSDRDNVEEGNGEDNGSSSRSISG
jgi:hypothetical protein